MTDWPETDAELDELGQAVRRAFSDESLSEEQQQRHLKRLCGHRTGAAGSRGRHRAVATDGRPLGRLRRVPRDRGWDGGTQSWLQFAAGVTAVAVVAAVLIVVFQSVAERRDADRPAIADAGTQRPRGWTYPAAELPGGGQLAFVSNQRGVPQISLVNADGSGLTVLTTDASTHWGPNWSPDGGQLTWASDARGAAQIYVAGADGAGVIQRSTFLDSRDPLWSPDGAWIAFISTRDERTDIYVMPAAGGREVSVTNGIALRRGANLVWSPDSQALAFETAGDIYVVNRDGTGLRQLTDHPAEDAAPGWSPDGSRIAFFSTRDGNAEIYVINADGSHLANLTNTPDNEYQPVWSPDGWSIAYLRAPAKVARDYETQLWSMGANGSGPRRLGEITGYGMSAPGWSPDSRRIAVIAAPKGSDLAAGTIDDGRLYVIDAGGGNQRLVHEHAADLGQPNWRPLWWPQSATPDAEHGASQPALTVVPAQGDCASRVMARGSGFEPGSVVTLYGAPAIDSSFAPAGEPVIVAADGRFETPLDLRRFAGCAGDAPAGGEFHVGAATERGEHRGASLADLFASATFIVRE